MRSVHDLIVELLIEQEPQAVAIVIADLEKTVFLIILNLIFVAEEDGLSSE